MVVDPVTINLGLEEEGFFNLSVHLNSEFGFFEDVNIIELVEIKFKCEEYPIDDINNTIQESVSLSLKYIQNDFEDYLDSYLLYIIILFIILIIIIFIFLRYIKR
jgi:hypothetical protein